MPPCASTTKPAGPAAHDALASLKHPARCDNIPPMGNQARGVLLEAPTIRQTSSPHLLPVLRPATDAAKAGMVLDLPAAACARLRTDAVDRLLADALPSHEPWLVWSGKRGKPWCEVEPVFRLPCWGSDSPTPAIASRP